LFTGASDHWVQLAIRDSEVVLQDAEYLAGKTVSETETAIKEDAGEKKLKISSIGPAGEHLVKYASIMTDDGRAAGRTGMGAVMGSKKLKAISVLGTGKTQLVDEEKFETTKKELLDEIKNNFMNSMFAELGSSGYLDYASLTGDMSFKYFTQGTWEGAYDISGASMKETILKKRYFCKQCSIGCGRRVEVPDGKYQLPGEVHGPEYESCGAFGGNLLCNDLRAIAKANYLCNQLGIDVVSCGVSIGFAYYLQDQGMLTPEQVDGLTLAWGDIDPAITLIEKIANREGFGDVLAEGTVAMANRLGVSTELCAAVNGMEVPFHDARAYMGTAIEYMTSYRGADHCSASYYVTSMGGPFPDVGILCIDRFQNEGAGRCTALLQDVRALYQSLSMCVWVLPSRFDILTDLFSSATGIEMTREGIMQAGERISTLRRLINLNLGYTTAGEKMPEILLRPLDGGTEKHVPDVELQLNEYYTFRDWDRATGRPSEAKIAALGLENLDPLL
jgi:aldehyde:ferredoxin oxidoreductase